MKQIAASVLISLLFVVVGCGKQNPAGATATPASSFLTQNEVDERHAANFLEAGKEYQQDGQTRNAKSTFKVLLDKYPNSDAAAEARQILAATEKQESGAGTTAGDVDSGEMISVRGLLKHYPQDVKSTEAWLGHEFMVGETAIRPTDDVSREFLLSIVGKTVEIEGPWNAGTKWEPTQPEDEAIQSATPLFPEGMSVMRDSGIEAKLARTIEE